jgi:Tfp pilus assembly protein PilX
VLASTATSLEQSPWARLPVQRASRVWCVKPEYLIEYINLSPDARLFRVTARGFGATAQAEIVLQSYISFD